jgi:hypothetical protein
MAQIAMMNPSNSDATRMDDLLRTLAALNDAGLDAVATFVAEEKARRHAAFQADAARRIREIAEAAGLTVSIDAIHTHVEKPGLNVSDAGTLVSDTQSPVPVLDKVPDKKEAKPARKTGKSLKKIGTADAQSEKPGQSEDKTGQTAGPLRYCHPSFPGYPAWDGKGMKPPWLTKALEEGAKLEDFLAREPTPHSE